MTRYSSTSIIAECHPISIPYIMIVESDLELASMLQKALKYEMKTGTIFASTMDEALNIARALCPTLFLINSHLPGGDGIALIDQLHQNDMLASIPVILLTTDLYRYQTKAEERGITCLSIPTDLSYLLSVIKNHLLINKFEGE